MIPKRLPDYSTKWGSRFWFDEMIYASNTATKRMYLDDKGLIRVGDGKKGLLRKELQTAYKQWAEATAERILVENELKTEKKD